MKPNGKRGLTTMKAPCTAWSLHCIRNCLSLLKFYGAYHQVGKGDHNEYDDETEVQAVSQKQGEKCEYAACDGNGDTHEYTVEAG